MEHARVLIVDDEPFARQTLSEWLREKNYDVLEAESGRQAMERIRKDKPDIVISDMVMPGMDGLQLLKEAKAAKADASFLMVTGYPPPSVAVNVMQHGASDYMVKPFSPGEVTRRVKRILLRKSLEKPQAAARGMIVGTAIAAILWALIIGAIRPSFRDPNPGEFYVLGFTAFANQLNCLYGMAIFLQDRSGRLLRRFTPRNDDFSISPPRGVN